MLHTHYILLKYQFDHLFLHDYRCLRHLRRLIYLTQLDYDDHICYNCRKELKEIVLIKLNFNSKSF